MKLCFEIKRIKTPETKTEFTNRSSLKKILKDEFHIDNVLTKSDIQKRVENKK